LSLGKYVKNVRKYDLEITLDNLSEKTNLSKGYLSKLENGERKTPQPETLKKLANGLQVPYMDLMKEAGYVEEVNSLFEAFGASQNAQETIKRGSVVASNSKGKETQLNHLKDDMDLKHILNSDEKVLYDKVILSDGNKKRIDDMIKIILNKEGD